MPQRKESPPRRRGAVRGAVLLALFASASSTARAQDLSCGATDVEVRSLKFEGNKALTNDELALRVTITPSSAARRKLHLPVGAKRCLNRAYLPLDLAKLKVYYLQRGYYSAQIDTVITTISRGVVGVVFRIKEGPVTMLTSYRVLGLEGVADSASIVRKLRLRQGQPYDLGLLSADLDSIKTHLRNSGYYRAETFTKTNRTDSTLAATVELDVEPGVRARYGAPEIHVTPLDNRRQQVPTDVVRRVAGITRGEFFSDRAITQAQRSLYQLGVYRHVEVEPLPDSLQPPGDSIVVLDIRLTEDYMKHIDSESGWATLDCGRVRVQYTDLNFLRSARRFELTGQASKIGFGAPLETRGTRDLCTLNGKSPLADDSAFSSKLHYFTGVSFRQPRLLGTRWVPTLSLYSERRGEFKAYLRNTNAGADVSATRDIADRTQLRIGYSQEYGSTRAPDAVLCSLFSRCDEASRRAISNVATLGIASASLTRVSTDNPSSPTRGSILRAELRSSASRLLGTSDSLFFNKASLEMAVFTPFGGRNVLSFRIRGGVVAGPHPTSFIPPQERLYAGGPTSIRGFQQNELGDVVYIARTRDVVKDSGATIIYHDTSASSYERIAPLGGNNLLVANLEYRVPDALLFPNVLQYTFFLDAGDVWNRGHKPEPKVTPGVGLRFITPIGPFSINFGYLPKRYGRQPGPMFFEDPARTAPGAINPQISPLYCVTPGNTIPLQIKDGVIQPPDSPPVTCPDFTPTSGRRWYERLTITFSIGSEF